MIKRIALAIGLLWFALAPASAQQVLCQTRPPGTNDNSCASTAFVQNAAGAPIPVFVTTSTYTVKPTDRLLVVNYAGPVTITLIPANTYLGGTLEIKDISGNANTNNITISGQTIDGLPSYVISNAYGGVALITISGAWLSSPVNAQCGGLLQPGAVCSNPTNAAAPAKGAPLSALPALTPTTLSFLNPHTNLTEINGGTFTTYCNNAAIPGDGTGDCTGVFVTNPVTSVLVQGTSRLTNQAQESALTINFTSATGGSAMPATDNQKIGLSIYTQTVAGGSNTWSINSDHVIRSGVGDQAGFGYELDFTNNNDDYPNNFQNVAYAFWINAVNSFRSNAAFVISSSNSGNYAFQNGLVFSNSKTISDNTISDGTSSQNSYRDSGSHATGISLAGTYSFAQISGTNFKVDPSGNLTASSMVAATGTNSVLPYTSANTGFYNAIYAQNSGTVSNSGTGAILLANLSAGAGTFAELTVTGGATPGATLQSGSGITGGLAISSAAGNVSVQGLTITASTGTLTIANSKTLTDTSAVGAKLLLGTTGGGFAAYGGASACAANNFVTALSNAGASTCGSSTISGVALGSNLGTLTFGTHLTSGGSSYNGSAGVTITSDATSVNTVSTIMARDGSGQVAATTFTGALTGNVTGNVSGTAATVTGAAQAAITSLGTLTGLTLNIGGASNAIFGTWGGGAYDCLSFSGNCAASTLLGMFGGGSGDTNLYFNANSGYHFRVSNTDAVAFGSTGIVNATGGYATNGTAGLASKTCTINTAGAATGITITITGGLITGTTTC